MVHRIEEEESPIQKLADNLGKKAGLLPRSEAWAKGVCVSCRELAIPKCYSPAGVREYRISGMCEKCFDNMFEE